MDFTSEVDSHASSHFTSGLAASGVDPMPLTAPTTLPAAKALVRWRYTSQLFGRCLKCPEATMIKGRTQNPNKGSCREMKTELFRYSTTSKYR